MYHHGLPLLNNIILSKLQSHRRPQFLKIPKFLYPLFEIHPVRRIPKKLSFHLNLSPPVSRDSHLHSSTNRREKASKPCLSFSLPGNYCNADFTLPPMVFPLLGRRAFRSFRWGKKIHVGGSMDGAGEVAVNNWRGGIQESRPTLRLAEQAVIPEM